MNGGLDLTSGTDRKGMAWMRAVTGGLWVVGSGLWAAAMTGDRCSKATQIASAAIALAVAVAPVVAAQNPEPTTQNPLPAAHDPLEPAEVPSNTADLLASVAAHIQRAPVLRGEFVQERTLAGFAKPLRSSGHFVAARGRGVLWVTQSPFPGELVITEDAIRERVDGSESMVVDASREPALQQVNRVLLALLQGDLAALREQFRVAGQDDPEGWILALTPQPPLSEAIGEIELGGNTQVNVVIIRERNGDLSRVEFHALSAGDALTADEAARLD